MVQLDTFQKNMNGNIRKSTIIDITDEKETIVVYITDKKKHISSVVGIIMNLARGASLRIRSRQDLSPGQVRLEFSI